MYVYMHVYMYIRTYLSFFLSACWPVCLSAYMHVLTNMNKSQIVCLTTIIINIAFAIPMHIRISKGGRSDVQNIFKCL